MTAKRFTPLLVTALYIAGCEAITDEPEPDFVAELQGLVADKLPSNGSLWLASSPEALEAMGLEVEAATQSGVRYASLTAFESAATFFGIGFSGDKMADTATKVHCSISVNVSTGWIKLGRCAKTALEHCGGVWGRMNGDRFEVTGYNAPYDDDNTTLLTPCTIPDSQEG